MEKLRVGVCSCTGKNYDAVFEGIIVNWRARKLANPRLFILTQRLVPEANEQSGLTIMRPHFFFDSHELTTRRGIFASNLGRLDFSRGEVTRATSPRSLRTGKEDRDGKRWAIRGGVSQRILIQAVNRLLAYLGPEELDNWLKRMDEPGSGGAEFACYWQ